MRFNKSRILLFVQIIFYLAVLWFVAQRFATLMAAIDPVVLVKKPLHILFSITFFVGFYGLLAVHWQKITGKFIDHKQHSQWLAFFASQPYKYLPSSIFTFSSRAVYAKKLGLPIKQSSLAQLIENANILLSGFCVAGLFLMYKFSFALGVAASATFFLAVL